MKKPIVLKNDLTPEAYEELSSSVELGVDCEMMGLNIYRDRLCLVQIGTEETHYLVQIDEEKGAPLLKKVLENEKVIKIFHFARMDCLFLKKRMDINTKNIFCTKIASKLVRTYTDRHGLKELVRELTGETMDKTYQSSYWGAENLSESQVEYAAGDIKYLFRLKSTLIDMLNREKRDHLAGKLFEFLPHRVELDILGYDDIFDHR